MHLGINTKGLENPQRRVFRSLACHTRGGNRGGNVPRLSTAKASSALLPSIQLHDTPYGGDVDGSMQPNQKLREQMSPPESSSNYERDLTIIGVSRTPQQRWDVVATVWRDRSQWYRQSPDSMCP